jgi:hypothetical protein
LIFDYPEPREQRRHGPAGYTEYKYYRPWLRDEFDFRCVYCLKRETWGQVTFDFELDHFKPQSLDPQLSLDYMNLVYACRRCNAIKRDQTVADPLLLLRRSRVATLIDGSLRPHDIETQRLIRQLDLNSPKLKTWRVMWMAALSDPWLDSVCLPNITFSPLRHAPRRLVPRPTIAVPRRSAD